MSESNGSLLFLQSCSLSLCLDEAGGSSFAVPIDVEQHKHKAFEQCSCIFILFLGTAALA